MIRASLSGDTLIACHYPVVQLPTWQLPVQALCSSSKRPGHLCSVGLTRAVSLPEQDSLHRESAFLSSCRHTSSSSLKEDRAEEEGASDSSGRYDSTSSPEEALLRTDSCMNKDHSGTGCHLRSHNSFLPNTGLEEDEEDVDSDGDNLHRYHEDSSFMLHGNSNWAPSNGTRNPKISHGDVENVWDRAVDMLETESNKEWLSNSPRQRPLEQLESQCFYVDKSNTTLTGCGEPESVRGKDNMSCFSHDQPKCGQESSANGHLEYVSDSSCNSSDGILVNFCTIYNKSNKPATPLDLSSPAAHSLQSTEGSVFLTLQPVPQAPCMDVQYRDPTVSSPSQEGVGVVPSALLWTPQGMDSNCNLYSQSLSSLEVSDLMTYLPSKATLAMGTNQKYYKLVTCDLPSQSPSPAWSSHTSCPEGHGRKSPVPHPECSFFNKEKRVHQKEQNKKEKDEKQKQWHRSSLEQNSSRFDCSNRGDYDSQIAGSSKEKYTCKKEYSNSIQSQISTDPIFNQFTSFNQVSLDHCNIQNTTSQGTNAVFTQPSVILDREHRETETEGACSWASPGVHYSKARRPTSLPIQPFVLQPPGKPQAQHLGSLLDQYISHRGNKPCSSQSGCKCEDKGNRVLTHLRPSPLVGNYGPILHEAPCSSDTCSTCSPSPEQFSHRPTWSQANIGQVKTSPCRPKTNLDLGHRSPNPMVNEKQDETSRYVGTSQTENILNLISVNLSQTPLAQAQDNAMPVKAPVCEDFINLTLDNIYTRAEDKHHSPIQSRNPGSYQSVASNKPHILSPATHTHHPNQLVSLSPPKNPVPERKPSQYPPVPVDESGFLHSGLTAALSSVAPLSSLTSLLSLAGSGLHTQETQHVPESRGKWSQHSEPLNVSDRPPVDFCLSPDASYKSMSISHLQRREGCYGVVLATSLRVAWTDTSPGLLRSVSMAVDLIMAHFGSSRDPEEKIHLGNSSRSPTIAGLVLEHLCPAIQNILEDGLRDHKLDIIIGQRRNHSWSIVEVSTKTGPCTRVLHSLVLKILQCPQLTSHCMRLRAFIMGLLNLRALEFWLSHLQSQKYVVSTYYHSWAFLSVTQERCQPQFQELLLLLQPLSVLPFELNLLLEPRLLQNRQLYCEDQYSPPLPPCSTLLMTSWPLLQADRDLGTCQRSRQTVDSRDTSLQLQVSTHSTSSTQQKKKEKHAEMANSPPLLAHSPGWWPRQSAPAYSVVKSQDCSPFCKETQAWSDQGIGRRQEERSGVTETGTPRTTSGFPVQGECPSQGGLRWAKLFGAAVDSSTRMQNVPQSPSGAQQRRYRRPSQWLLLDRSQLGLLAHSMWSMTLGGGPNDKR